MQSKTSYFSKTIFFKNMTHYWPIWSAYLLICLVRLPLKLFIVLGADVSDSLDPAQTRLDLLTESVNTALQPFWIFLFACITAVAVFSYLYQTRSSYMLHALPVCRESLFITNVLSGLSFLVIPQILAFLASIFVCFLRQMTQLDYLLHWLILSAGMVVFAFAMAVFMVMITGNILAAPIFFLLGNYLFVILRGLISFFVEALSYGVQHAEISFGTFLSPYYFLNQYFTGFFSALFGLGYQEHALKEVYPYMGFYAAVSLLLLALAFVIYKKKHLETAGDIVAIGFLKPLFRWGIAFALGSCVTLICCYSFMDISFLSTSLLPLLAAMLVSSAVFFFLAEMILEKRFLVFSKKRLLECAGFLGVCALFLVGMKFDMFGVERKIPRQEEIAAITVYGSYNIDVMDEDFPKVLEIHRRLIAEKQEVEDYFNKYSQTARYTPLNITYRLKNGGKISRSYYIPVEDYYLSQENYVYHDVTELFQRPEYYLRYHFTDAYESITFLDGSLDLYDADGTYDSISFNQAQCQQIYEAFLKDVQEGNYQIYDYAMEDYASNLVYENYLTFSYQVPQGSTYISYDSYGGTAEMASSDNLQSTGIQLTTDCEHTLSVLRELNVFDENHRLFTRQEMEVINQYY